MTDDEASRLDRLRALCEVLAAPDPSPGDSAGDDEWDVWMDRVGADSSLAGLLHSAIHGARSVPAELSSYREASERFGSRLDAGSVAEAYRLLSPQRLSSRGGPSTGRPGPGGARP